jgi:uncharacterized protein (TIRG00374 family)
MNDQSHEPSHDASSSQLAATAMNQKAAPPATRMLRRAIHAGVVVFLAAMVLYGLLAAHSLHDTLAKLDGGLLVWVLGCSVLNYLLRFMRWHMFLGHLGTRPALGTSLVIYLAGYAFTTTPGKSGEAVRSWWLRDHGVRLDDSLGALIMERVCDLVAVLLLALLCLSLLGAGQGILLIGAASGCLLFAMSLRPVWLAALGKRLEGRNGLMVRLVQAAIDAILRAWGLVTPSMLGIGLLTGLVAWAAEGWGLYLLVHAIHPGIAPGLVIGIYAASLLAGAISMIPGGVGGAEGAMVLLLGAIGLGSSQAMGVTMVSRLATLWFGVVVGALCCLAYLLQHRMHSIHES